MAQIFADFGANVTSWKPKIGFSQSRVGIATELAAAMNEEPNIGGQTGVRVGAEPGEMHVSWQEGEIETSITVDRVLMATGKRPQVDALGREWEWQSTSRSHCCGHALPNEADHIFAVGDVIGGLMLAIRRGSRAEFLPQQSWVKTGATTSVRTVA